MRPLLLAGHERPITQLVFNRQGDLLFTVAKSNKACVWYSETGERLGTYKGHNGAIWSIDVDWDTTKVLTGSGDNTARLWDAQTGREIFIWKFKAPVRFVKLDHGEKRFLAVTDQVMGLRPTVCIYELSSDLSQQVDSPTNIITVQARCLQAWWTPLNKHILCVCDDGTLRLYDPSSGDEVQCVKAHEKSIHSINFSLDFSHFITASLDCSAKIYDTRSFECIRSFDAGRPVNAAAISPTKPHIILGGGQSAETVTTTKVDSSQFKVRFFNYVYGDEIAAVQGHFGPVNALTFHPSGKGFVSGGEDGYVRLHWFDEAYYTQLSDKALYGIKAISVQDRKDTKAES